MTTVDEPAVTTVRTPGDGSPPRRSLRRPILIAVAAIVLIVALVYGLRYLAYASSHETTDDAQIDSDQVQITSKIAERVDRIPVRTNQYVHKGDLLIVLDDRDERHSLAQAQAAVAAQAAQARAAQEQVSLTRATQGAQNAQGSAGIAQAHAAIAQANAGANSAQQQIAVAQAQADAAKAQVKAAGDAVPAARQNLAKAAADLRRTSSLVRTGDVAVAQLDASQAAYAAAQASYAQAVADASAAEAQLDQAEQHVTAQRFEADASQAGVIEQQALLASAQGKLAESAAPARVPAQQAAASASQAQTQALMAQLRVARDKLAYTRIYAPIDGYVGQKNVEIGATVSPGQSLMTLIPSNGIFVTANYKETQVGRMHPGQPAAITIDAYPGVTFQGHVGSLAPASQNQFSLVPAQNATGNFVKVTQRVPVRIFFDHPDPRYPLRPGLSVETSVQVK
ncbi:MAG: HlyD family secretion protein [Vulcanimicrobiaceae bacterium]